MMMARHDGSHQATRLRPPICVQTVRQSCVNPVRQQIWSNCALQGLPEPLAETTVSYTAQLPGSAAADLLAMTPYAHHRGAAERQAAMRGGGAAVSVTVDIVVASYTLG